MTTKRRGTTSRPPTSACCAQQHDAFPNLVSQKQTDGLQALLAPIYIVSQEKVIGFRWESAIFKQPEKIRVLAMNVACSTYADIRAGSWPFKAYYEGRL
jgi:hypothetical protein